MTAKTVAVVLRANVDAYQSAMKNAGASTQQLSRNVADLGTAGRADLEHVGKGALVMAAGIAAGLGLSVKAAMDWESSWAGVQKTVDGSASQMADLEAGLRDLAGELPATHGEIAAVAEAAGQLGIQRESIEGFTKTMIDLGETTNLTADQAATAMARMANIMRTPQGEIDRMASTLVALGNAGASTESEILDMAQRIAGAGQQVGASEADVLALANALSSVGIEAEAGGTAISRVFSTIASAVADGGDEVAGFAEVAGMSVEEFSRAFQEDAAGATVAFIEGLDGISASGGNVFATLEQLELGDIRVRDALLRAAGAGDLFRESLALGAQEWEANLALQTEAEKRYDTTAAKLEVARNSVVDLGIDLGGVLLPALAGAAEGATSMVQGFSAMPGPVEALTVGVGGLAVAGLGMVAAASILIPKIVAMRTALINLGTAGRVASASMPWLAAAAAAVGVVSYVFGEHAKKAEEAEDRVKGYTDAIIETGSVLGGAEAKLADYVSEHEDFAEMVDASGLSLRDFAEGLSGSDADFDALIGKLRDADEAGVDLGYHVGFLERMLGSMRGEVGEAAGNADRLSRVLGETGDAAATAAPDLDTMTGALGLNAEAAEKARSEFEKLLNEYRGAVDPLFGVLDALETNREAMGAEAELRAEGLRGITEAEEDLADAEADLADARTIPDNAAGIAAAEERLVDARERLAEANEEAIITDEELASMNRDVAESALEVETATRELAAGVRDGRVDLDDAKAMLKEWEDQGLITAEQAEQVGRQFALALGIADAFAKDWVASVYLVGGDEAIEQLGEINQLLVGLQAALGITPAPRPEIPDFWQGLGTALGVTPASERKAAGGRAGTGPFGTGPHGTDVIPAMLSPGEFVMSAPAAQAFGYGNLEAINQGQAIIPAAAPTGSTQYDQSRHVTFQVTQQLEAPSPRDAAMESVYELRVLAAGMGG